MFGHIEQDIFEGHLVEFQSWNEFQDYVNMNDDWSNWPLYSKNDYAFQQNGCHKELHIADPYQGYESVYGYFSSNGVLLGVTTLSNDNGCLWVGDFQVSMSYQHKGVGRSMWQAICDTIDFIDAECTYKDDNALAFWLRMGWKKSHAKVLEYHKPLNESGYAETLCGDAPAGFSYHITGLKTNLQQSRQGREVSATDEYNDEFKFGDYVEGLSLNDKKEHKGTIESFDYSKDGNKIIAHIVDQKTSKVEPLNYSTLKMVDNDDDLEGVYDYFAANAFNVVNGNITSNEQVDYRRLGNYIFEQIDKYKNKR